MGRRFASTVQYLTTIFETFEKKVVDVQLAPEVPVVVCTPCPEVNRFPAYPDVHALSAVSCTLLVYVTVCCPHPAVVINVSSRSKIPFHMLCMVCLRCM